MPRAIDLDHLHAATVQVFAERGFEAATTREIATRAGVNEVTLFRRFGTKTELVRASLEAVLGASPLARIEGSGDLAADVAAIAGAYARTFEAWGGAVMTLIVEAGRNPDLAPLLAVLKPNLARAAAILAAHQAAGRLGPGAPMPMLSALIAPLALAGMARRAGLLPDAAAAPADPAALARAFLHGHAAGG